MDIVLHQMALSPVRRVLEDRKHTHKILSSISFVVVSLQLGITI